MWIWLHVIYFHKKLASFSTTLVTRQMAYLSHSSPRYWLLKMTVITKPDIYECFYFCKNAFTSINSETRRGRGICNTYHSICLLQPLSDDKWAIMLNCWLFPPGKRHYIFQAYYQKVAILWKEQATFQAGLNVHVL